MGVQAELRDIASGYLSAAAHTANNTLIEEALNKALDRTASIDNAMEVDLDMATNDILNANSIHTGALYISGDLVTVTALNAVNVVKHFDTMVEAIASTTLVVGDVLIIKDRANSVWDVVLSSGVTENGYEIVQGVGVGTLSYVLRTDGDYISFEAFGILADNSTVETATLQHIFTYINTNGGKYIAPPTGTIVIDSTVSLHRSNSNHARNWEIDWQGCKVRSTQTSGAILSFGASSESFISDTGKIKIKNLEVIGPETGNGTTDTPATTTIGLNLQFALNLEVVSPRVSKCYTGYKSEFCFPAVVTAPDAFKCYIGYHLIDASNNQLWLNPQATSCRFAYVLQGEISAASYGINDVTFQTPRAESCLVGWTIDPGNDTAADQIRGVSIIEPFIAQMTYDHVRVGLAFDPTVYATRGADVVGTVFGLKIKGGHWSYTYQIGVLSPLVVSSTGTVIGADITAPWLYEHITGNLVDSVVTLTTSADSGYSSTRKTQVLIGGDTPATTSARLHVEASSGVSPVMCLYSRGTGGGEAFSIYSDNGGTKVKKLEVSAAGIHDYRGPTQTTVGAAGGASALPATPTGYLEVAIGGVAAVIPYYAKS